MFKSAPIVRFLLWEPGIPNFAFAQLPIFSVLPAGAHSHPDGLRLSMGISFSSGPIVSFSDGQNPWMPDARPFCPNPRFG